MHKQLKMESINKKLRDESERRKKENDEKLLNKLKMKEKAMQAFFLESESGDRIFKENLELEKKEKKEKIRDTILHQEKKVTKTIEERGDKIMLGNVRQLINLIKEDVKITTNNAEDIEEKKSDVLLHNGNMQDNNPTELGKFNLFKLLNFHPIEFVTSNPPNLENNSPDSFQNQEKKVRQKIISLEHVNNKYQINQMDITNDDQEDKQEG